MKQGIISSYIAGILDTKKGESFSTIIGYWVPEFITNVVLYSMPLLLDAWFISYLKSTTTYAALGTTNTFLHLIIKIAEAFSVGTVILIGVHNGAGEYEKAGKSLRDAFWTSLVLGFSLALFLFIFAKEIYIWHGLDRAIVELSVPFMRLRAISVALMFASFAFIGFLRGIKNTKTPMYIFILGMMAFIGTDYVLIFGKLGFGHYGLQGSAIASIVQYSVMLILSLLYILVHPANKRYAIDLFAFPQSLQEVERLIRISIPIIMDKAIMAIAYIWLCRMMATVGTCGVAAFCVVKDMERFALIPAIACAHVITFLVSNNIGAHQWSAVKINIKKVILIAAIAVGSLLFLFSMFPRYFIELFDKNGDFVCMASKAFPALSLLAFFDLLQLVLSGALRGAGAVRIVMFTRLAICFGFFIPISWFVIQLHIENELIRFMTIYGLFYLGNAFMSIVYLYQFRSNRWKHALEQEE